MSKFIDLTGQTFGKWIVLERDEEHSTKRTIKWKCQCSCENHTIKYISGESLRNGNSKSCGCIKSPDLTGQNFGRWTVLKRDNTIHKNDVYWICECSCDKHTIKSVSTSNLKTENSRSCGCLANVDIAGKTFGRWTALKYDKERSTYKSRYWICQCSCENNTIRSVLKSDLTTGKSLSCGCLQKEVISDIKGIDLTGQIFGKWTVLGLDDKKSNNVRKYWFVQCSCESHTIKSVQTGTLRSGDSQSCGCLISVMETTAKKYFEDIGLDFIQQYIYDDCVYESKLKFDFYLPYYNCCIEFDGKHHFEPVQFNGITLEEAEENFKIQQIRDEIKNKYCKNNNIKLIRISYLEFKNYKDILFEQLGIGGEKCL